MRLVHLIRGYAPAYSIGGPIQMSSLLCEGLREKGWEVSVLTTMEGQEPESPVRAGSGWQTWNGVSVRYCRALPLVGFSGEYLVQLGAAVAKADVVQVSGTFSVEALSSVMMAALTRKPYIVTPHGSLEPWALSTKSWKKTPALALLRPFLNRAYAVHATSSMEARNLRVAGIRAPIVVVPNPIPDPPALPEAPGTWRKALCIGEQDPLLLILGRVHPVKGIDIAVQAMSMVLKRLPTAVLVIAGPGEARYDRVLVDLAAAVGVQDHVRRVPMIIGVDKYQLLRDADLVLLPSRQENFGNVAAEALSIGTPVIASQATPWQSLEHSGCGRWVPLSAEAFTDAIVQLAGDRVRLNAARREAPVEFRKYRAPDFLRKMMTLYTAGASGAPVPSLAAGVP